MTTKLKLPLTYNIIDDLEVEGVQYAQYKTDDRDIQVPWNESMTDDEIQMVFNQIDFSELIERIATPSIFHDDVYVAQEKVRTDYNVNADEGQELIAAIEEVFPAYTDWYDQEYNVIGAFGAYRLPYTGQSISWYSFGAKPSVEVLNSYGVTYTEENLKPWYGLKFNLETNEVMAKIVFNDYDGDLPANWPARQELSFYATTHNQDGSVFEWIDGYVYATEYDIKKWCVENNLAYPLPESIEDDDSFVWCWGIVFHKDTLEIKSLKGYARYQDVLL